MYKYSNYLIFNPHLIDPLLPEYKRQSGKEQQYAVTKIAEHDAKEEGEGDNCVGCWNMMGNKRETMEKPAWIDFPIGGNPVRIHNVLEDLREFVRPIVGWMQLARFQNIDDWANCVAGMFLKLVKNKIY